MAEALFFLIQTLTEAVYSQAARTSTMCPLYTENPGPVFNGLLRMIPLIFTVFSCDGAVWDIS